MTTSGHGAREVTAFGRSVRIDVRPGDRSRPPLVMCCGIGASLDVLQPLVDAIDPGIEIVRFDVPGVGGSPAPLLPYAFPQLATLVMRMLRNLGYDKVDILGFSWGGALAQQLAAQYPQRVRRLVLLCTGTGTLMVPGNPRVLLRMLSPRRFRDPEYAASVAALLYGGGARTRADEVLRLFHQHSGGSRRGYLYQLLAGSAWTSLPFLWLVRQPTLVLVGDDDPIVPDINGALMTRLLARGELVTFRGGHVEPVIRPVDIARPIVAFLNRSDNA